MSRNQGFVPVAAVSFAAFLALWATLGRVKAFCGESSGLRPDSFIKHRRFEDGIGC